MSQSTAMQERMESVSRKILITARNELYMKMRFLDVALSCMSFIPDTGADGMGTDGLYLYYDPHIWGDCSGRPRYGEPDLSASVLMVSSGICSGEREEKSGFIIWPAILWQNPSSTGFSTAV